MRLTKEQQAAVELFRDFREREPTRAKQVELIIPEALMVMGPCEFIGYRTTHGRAGRLYQHEFAGGSRPLLCAGPEDNQLFLIGGRFRVTERGIVDLDRRSAEIDDDSPRARKFR